MNKLTLLGCLLFLISCNKEDPVDFACGHEVSLANDIMPILETNCNLSLCHGGGIDPILTSMEMVIINSSSIKLQTETFQMPPASQVPLTSEEIELINCWVLDGARDN